MQSHHSSLSVFPVAPLAEKQANQPAEIKNSMKLNGEVDMEPRVTELKHASKCIRRDMEDIRSDSKSIKHRLPIRLAGQP
jgi:hypothetical protein